MASSKPPHFGVLILIVLLLAVAGISCSTDAKPGLSKKEINLDPNIFEPEHPELFKLARAETRVLPVVLTANGSVTPDVNRTVHVTSLGAGRAVDLRVQLGDFVKKGQVLLVISSPDLATATSDYKKARADETLARQELARTQLLYAHGALAQKDLQLAQDVEDKAKVDLQTAEDHVRQLGGDPANSTALIQLRAPVAGTIVEQNVAGFEGVKSLDNTPNLLTIADLSQVWVVCDVYENDLADVHLGDSAEIRLNAYPDTSLPRHESATSRGCSIRLRVRPKCALYWRMPMARCVPTCTRLRPSAPASCSPGVVPATAMMRLQDKDWVFRKEGQRAIPPPGSSSRRANLRWNAGDSGRTAARATKWWPMLWSSPQRWRSKEMIRAPH